MTPRSNHWANCPENLMKFGRDLPSSFGFYIGYYAIYWNYILDTLNWQANAVVTSKLLLYQHFLKNSLI